MASPRGTKTNFISSDLQRIRQMLTDGLTQGEIARAFNVHPSTISRVIAQHDLHDEKAPLNELEVYLAREKAIYALHERAYKAYHSHDYDALEKIEDEIRDLKEPHFADVQSRNATTDEPTSGHSPF